MRRFAVALFLLSAAAVGSAGAQSYPTKTVRVIVPYSIGGLDASSEQGSRLRDANVRESAAAPVLIAQASIPGATYPSKTVRVIVPYSIGGGTDIMTRIVTQKLTELWGQQIVVDNRPGGGTVIGTQLAANAAADGYTIFVAAPSFVINETTRSNLPYNVMRDFKPLTIMAYQPYVLVTNPKVPARDVREFIALAKEKPDALNFGSTGTGSGSHLAAELFKYMTNIRPEHISYKGMGPAVIDTLSGQVQFLFGSVLSCVPHIRSGKLHALGVSSEKRSAALPDLPTIAEAGVPGYSTVSWSGMLVPARVPDAIIAKLSADLNGVLARPDVRERFMHDAAEPGGGRPEDFARFIRDEIVKWRKVITAANIHID